MSAILDWLSAHPIVTLVLIYVFLVYIYNKVFKVRRLPILKEILIYFLILIGAFLLTTFQVFMQLPIVPSLSIAVLLMLMVRIRYFVEARQSRKS
ncbi:hypothetical protein J31TS4_29280 [Paenibacillus sp. J31TS4]|uniref:YlaH-like family protein n=1 Tax=Paenibacillus sp. J31TS4 TaxID=2807195 RepID=UPI001B04F542|nr:YlaH-like family protein [Paenibacillus sp. J31TS4]GIP39648.1 hypothetical protein J31TS4_29280 [Paenibacillus sp. J31TS4]